MSVLHDSIRTESAYVDWIVWFRRVLRIGAAGDCIRGCSASRDPFWWLCELRILLLQSSAC
ncbi:MAG UNVERIFIED_CONTAM: hypothetical protein LVR18_03825 [Planctomycetaceae bacterium]